MSRTPPDRRSFCTAVAATLLSAGGTAAARIPEDAQVALWRGLEFQDQAGRSFQIGSAAAPLTLVKLWAHWCPACYVEMSSLAALATAVGPALDVVLVSHPEYWAQDLLAAQRHDIRFRMITPAASNTQPVIRAALTLNGAYDVPRSLAFRPRDNSIAWSHLGSMDWAAATTVAQMRALAAG